jgi:hypothetical protein
VDEIGFFYGPYSRHWRMPKAQISPLPLGEGSGVRGILHFAQSRGKTNLSAETSRKDHSFNAAERRTAFVTAKDSHAPLPEGEGVNCRSARRLIATTLTLNLQTLSLGSTAAASPDQRLPPHLGFWTHSRSGRHRVPFPLRVPCLAPG